MLTGAQLLSNSYAVNDIKHILYLPAAKVIMSPPHSHKSKFPKFNVSLSE